VNAGRWDPRRLTAVVEEYKLLTGKLIKAVAVRLSGKSNFMLGSCGLEYNFISSLPHIRLETRDTVGPLASAGGFVVTIS
jgi:hypothetical protein